MNQTIFRHLEDSKLTRTITHYPEPPEYWAVQFTTDGDNFHFFCKSLEQVKVFAPDYAFPQPRLRDVQVGDEWSYKIDTWLEVVKVEGDQVYYKSSYFDRVFSDTVKLLSEPGYKWRRPSTTTVQTPVQTIYKEVPFK